MSGAHAHPKPNMLFSAEEWLRYTRHIQLPNIGACGQAQLKNSRVLIVGAGGLGAPVGLYLAAAGIGYLRIVDHDTVDTSNLQRQIIFDTHNVNEKKSYAAAERLRALNPHIDIDAVEEAFSADNAERHLNDIDLVIDCTDNFATRYLINDNCAKYRIPWLYASIHQFSGQCSLFTHNTGCFRCVFPEAPQTQEDCNSAGVLGVLPGLLGTLQANEALKHLCGLETPLQGRLLLVDAIELSMQKITLSKNPECPCCFPKANTKTSLPASTCTVEPVPEQVTSKEFNQQRDNSKVTILDVRNKAERAGFHIGGLHIPLDTLETRLQELAKDQLILCYCQSGKRSQQACNILAKEGLSAKSLEGGLASHLKHLTPNT